MRKKIFFIFLFSLLLIILGTILFKDEIKGYLEHFLNEEESSFEETFVLENFESVKDIDSWEKYSADIDLAQVHSHDGENSGKVVFFAKKDLFPRILLEDADLGPKGLKDWSDFDYLNFYIYNPQVYPIDLYLQIKDDTDKRYKQSFKLNPREINHVKVSLLSVASSVSLKNISQMNFYLKNLIRDVTLYFDSITLDKNKQKQNISKAAILKVVNVNLDKDVYLGKAFKLSADFSLDKIPSLDYRFFVHIYPSKYSPDKAKDKGAFYNPDFGLTIKDVLDKDTLRIHIPSLEIKLPSSFGKGLYNVDMGFFRSADPSIDYKYEVLIGHYIRLIYQDNTGFTLKQINVG